VPTRASGVRTPPQLLFVCVILLLGKANDSSSNQLVATAISHSHKATQFYGNGAVHYYCAATSTLSVVTVYMSTVVYEYSIVCLTKKVEALRSTSYNCSSSSSLHTVHTLHL
jgi:hypothetical protein